MTALLWISVGERMPDDDETVMIFSGEEVWMGYHDGDDGWRDVRAERCRVTHWAPLPEGPK